MSPESPRREPRETVLQEAARRRMFRVAGGYISVSFAVLQGVLTLIHLHGLPEGWFRAILGVALMGFPVAMVLAWDYDVTPQGIVRTTEDPPDTPLPPPPLWRWALLVGGSLVVGVALALAR